MVGVGYRLIAGAALCAALYGFIPTGTIGGKVAMVTGALTLLAAPLIARNARLPDIPDRYFWHVFAAGLVLRAAWLTTEGGISSDALTYSKLAASLALTGEYEIGGRRAYWPPGLPVALVVTGSAALLNGLIYLASAFLIHRLASMWGLAALAAWPTGIMLAWVPSKELLCLPLLLGALYAFRKGRPVVSGVLIGCAALTYSVLVVFPLVFLFERRARQMAITALVAVVVVSPWVVRNAVVLGQPVLGTNAGINLYIGNNAKLSAVFVEPVELPQLPELERNAHAKNLALAWIAANPDKAVLLSLRKLIVYFGDDDTGAYWALKRGHGIDGPLYDLARGVANLHWVALLFMFYVSAMRGARPDRAAVLGMGLGVAVAAVFFGHSSHHIEFEGFLIMLALTPAVIAARSSVRAPALAPA